jgi:predicted GNAT family acetyltransferase
MEDVQLNLDENNRGIFFITEGEDQLGEMEVAVQGNNLIVYHTEVSPKAEGKGLAKKMLATMVEYARAKKLKVIPLCPFVLAQFKRHPEEFADVWNKEGVS